MTAKQLRIRRPIFFLIRFARKFLYLLHDLNFIRDCDLLTREVTLDLYIWSFELYFSKLLRKFVMQNIILVTLYGNSTLAGGMIWELRNITKGSLYNDRSEEYLREKTGSEIELNF